MPRGWFEGNWDGIADCEPCENDKGREFFLTGHINLNRSEIQQFLIFAKVKLVENCVCVHMYV